MEKKNKKKKKTYIFLAQLASQKSQEKIYLLLTRRVATLLRL